MSSVRYPKQTLHSLLARRVDNDLLVLNEKNQQIHQLNQTAALIWEACDGSQSAAEIASYIQSQYEAPLHKIENDVNQILRDLETLGLIAYEG